MLILTVLLVIGIAASSEVEKRATFATGPVSQACLECICKVSLFRCLTFLFLTYQLDILLISQSSKYWNCHCQYFGIYSSYRTLVFEAKIFFLQRESGGCHPIGCHMDSGSLSCGYFQIKEPYWNDCGRLGSGEKTAIILIKSYCVPVLFFRGSLSIVSLQKKWSWTSYFVLFIRQRFA